MQQQIYIEEQQPTNPLAPSIHQQTQKQNQQAIQQNITQNYQDDFESISHIDHHQKQQQHQIQEEYPQDYQQIDEGHKYQGFSYKQLQKQCKKMREQIQRKCKQYQKIIKLGQNDRIIRELEQNVNKNNMILKEIQQQKLTNNNQLNNNTTSNINHGPSQNDEFEDLVAQIDKIKALIILYKFEINKQQRQIKKNQDLLPQIQNKQQQIHIKYRQIKKQLQEKVYKYDNNKKKQDDLDKKIDNIQQIIHQIVQYKNNYKEQIQKMEKLKQMQDLRNKLIKNKDNQIKRNTLISHQIQNQLCMIKKTINQLKQQNQELNNNITTLENKNLNIESDSQRLMQKYMKKQQKFKEKITIKQLSIKKKDECVYLSKQDNIICEYQKQPQQNYKKQSFYNKKVTEGSLITEIKIPYHNQDKHQNIHSQRYFTTIKRKNNTTINKSQTNNNNTLKHFKLKLPISNSTQTQLDKIKNQNIHKNNKSVINNTDVQTNDKMYIDEQKKLQSSLKILQPSLTVMPMRQSHKFETKQNLILNQSISKLTIPQRIQKIQLRQRQDRIFSSKLYDKIDQLRQSTKIQFNKSKNIVDNYDYNNKSISSMNKFQIQTQKKYQEKTMKKVEYDRNDNKTQINKNFKDHLQSFSSNINSVRQINNKNDISLRSQLSEQIYSQAQLPSNKKSYLINKRQSNSLKKQNIFLKVKQDANNHEDNTQLYLPKSQTSMLSYNKSLNTSLNQSINYDSTNILDSSFNLNTTMMSSQSISNVKFKRKRNFYGQKKISQDYMKILEERGRKILQLDNQNDT